MNNLFLVCVLFASVILSYTQIGLLAKTDLQIPLAILIVLYLHNPSRSSFILAASTGFMLDLHGMVIGPLTILLPSILLLLNFFRETFIRTTGIISHLTTITAGVFMYCIGLAAALMLVNGFEYYRTTQTVSAIVRTFIFTVIITIVVDLTVFIISKSLFLHEKRSI